VKCFSAPGPRMMIFLCFSSQLLSLKSSVQLQMYGKG